LADVGSASNGRLKLRHDEQMYLRKLLIGLICLPLFAQGGLTLTPAEIDVRHQDTAKLRAMIEAAPKLPLVQTDLVVKLPKGQQLGMVSWLARDPKTGVTRKVASCTRLVKDCTRFLMRSGSTRRATFGRSMGRFDSHQV
jgi:Tfp pilus assembly protein PilN